MRVPRASGPCLITEWVHLVDTQHGHLRVPRGWCGPGTSQPLCDSHFLSAPPSAPARPALPGRKRRFCLIYL